MSRDPRFIKQVVQGEMFPIFLRIMHSNIHKKVDEIWAETDDGIKSTNLIANPPFATPLQLYFEPTETMKVSVGLRHIRIWAKEQGYPYVLLETEAIFLPAFPFTEETKNKDYEWTNPTRPIRIEMEDKEGEVHMETAFQSKLDSPAAWNRQTSFFRVNSKSELPVKDVDPGDTAETIDTGLLYLCVELQGPDYIPVWKQITDPVFVGSYQGLVPESTDSTQLKVLRGDGTWSVIDSSMIDKSNFIINNDAVRLDGGNAFTEFEV